MTTNFAYDDQGRLCAVGASDCSSPNVTYNDAGMTEIIGGWFYRYDSARHLVSACQSTSCTGSGFNRVDFTYDGEGNRTAITDTVAGGVVTTTVFTYQGGVITGETVNGTPTRSYIAAGGTTAEMTIPPGSGAGTYIVVWNGHGDAGSLDLLNADGTLTPVNTFSYSTWGAPTTTVSSGATDLAFRFLYVGSGDVQTDNDFGLGLEYMHARTYSPALGRFLQPDPSRADLGYVYAGNAPIGRTDARGTVSSSYPDPPFYPWVLFYEHYTLPWWYSGADVVAGYLVCAGAAAGLVGAMAATAGYFAVTLPAWAASSGSFAVGLGCAFATSGGPSTLYSDDQIWRWVVEWRTYWQEVEIVYRPSTGSRWIQLNIRMSKPACPDARKLTRAILMGYQMSIQSYWSRTWCYGYY